jgi:hypothetical protein
MIEVSQQNASLADILDCLSLYFDGLYFSDTDRLAQVFHPQARYVCATAGDQRNLSLEEYVPIVAARPSPASRQEARQDRIVSVTLAGPDMAFAHVNCAIGPRYFTDFLTLVRSDGEWRIIAKVFDYDVREAA